MNISVYLEKYYAHKDSFLQHTPLNELGSLLYCLENQSDSTLIPALHHIKQDIQEAYTQRLNRVEELVQTESIYHFLGGNFHRDVNSLEEGLQVLFAVGVLATLGWYYGELCLFLQSPLSPEEKCDIIRYAVEAVSFHHIWNPEPVAWLHCVKEEILREIGRRYVVIYELSKARPLLVRYLKDRDIPEKERLKFYEEIVGFWENPLPVVKEDFIAFHSNLSVPVKVLIERIKKIKQKALDEKNSVLL